MAGLGSFSELPQIKEFIGNAPDIWIKFAIIVTVLCALDVALAIPHFVKLFVGAKKAQKETFSVFPATEFVLYAKLFAFGPLIGTLACGSIFSVRFALLFDLLLALYEGFCILWFWRLMVLLVGGIDNFMIFAGNRQEYKVMHLPPFICFPCFQTPRKFRKKDLVLSYILVAQFATMTLFTVLASAISQGGAKYFKYIGIASMVFGIYGLMLVFFAAKEELQLYNVGYKFASIKVSFVIIKILDFITSFESVFKGGNTSYPPAFIAVGWRAAILSGLSLVLTISSIFLYPCKELERVRPSWKIHVTSEEQIEDTLRGHASDGETASTAEGKTMEEMENGFYSSPTKPYLKQESPNSESPLRTPLSAGRLRNKENQN